MNTSPEIKLIFALTKKDGEDFDRNAVTEQLGIMPSETSAPRLSEGLLYSNQSASEIQRELPSVTVLESEHAPYQLLLHAFWQVELRRFPCWSLDVPLRQLEDILSGRETMIHSICTENNLMTNLIIRVFAESNRMPEMIIPTRSVGFWAALGVQISFDFYLD